MIYYFCGYFIYFIICLYNYAKKTALDKDTDYSVDYHIGVILALSIILVFWPLIFIFTILFYILELFIKFNKKHNKGL